LINHKKVSILNKKVRDLFSTIVPPAVFVAVMALQLKYFGLHVSNEQQMREQLGAAQHRQLSFLQAEDAPLGESKEEIKAPEGNLKDGNADIGSTGQLKASPVEEKRKHIQEVVEKYWNLAQKTVSIATEAFWRLLEISLPKAIIFVLFAAIINEISASHFLVLVILVVAIPIEIYWFIYFILTTLISSLTLLKMIYQLALVGADSFKFSNCSVSVQLDILFIN